MKRINHSLNIIYLNITEKGPSGGKKTIYYHSNLINKLNIPNVTSEILHIKKKKLANGIPLLKKYLKFLQKITLDGMLKTSQLVKILNQIGLKTM